MKRSINPRTQALFTVMRDRGPADAHEIKADLAKRFNQRRSALMITGVLRYHRKRGRVMVVGMGQSSSNTGRRANIWKLSSSGEGEIAHVA